MLMSFLRGSIKQIRSQKLSLDIAYSIGGFGILALSGIAINIIIAWNRDAVALGVFNLAYAVYIVVAQIATWGMQYSVLRHSAFYAEDRHERTVLLGTAGAFSLLMGNVVAIVIYHSEALMVSLFHSETAAAAIQLSAFGLILFPFSKVLLAYLNGLRHMRAHAMLQSMRYLLIMACVAVVAISPWPIEYCALSFAFAESIMMLSAIGYIAINRLSLLPRFSNHWLRRHMVFGTKSLPSGLLTEVNARIDVILIGFFMTERAVGIYSFAAMLVDGVYHLLAMVRINFNPLLVAAIKERDVETCKELLSRSKRYCLPATLVLSAILALAYWITYTWVLPGKDLSDGMVPMLILLAGVATISVWIPFDNLMMVSGFPGYQAMQQVAGVGANIISISLLIPVYGLNGVAAGTAFSYLIGTSFLIIYARRKLGWDLVNNR